MSPVGRIHRCLTSRCETWVTLLSIIPSNSNGEYLLTICFILSCAGLKVIKFKRGKIFRGYSKGAIELQPTTAIRALLTLHRVQQERIGVIILTELINSDQQEEVEMFLYIGNKVE